MPQPYQPRERDPAIPTMENIATVLQAQKELFHAEGPTVTAKLEGMKDLFDEQNRSNKAAAEKTDKNFGDQLTQQGRLLESKTSGLESGLASLDKRFSVVEGGTS